MNQKPSSTLSQNAYWRLTKNEHESADSATVKDGGVDVVLIVFDLPEPIQGDGADVEDGSRAEIHVEKNVHVAKKVAQTPHALVHFHVKTASGRQEKMWGLLSLSLSLSRQAPLTRNFNRKVCLVTQMTTGMKLKE